MNEIKLKVNFAKRTCVKTGVALTTNDFNSTKIIFDFDREDGQKVFEMINPSGKLVYLGEILNNEIILAGKTADGKLASLFTEEGQYVFEISLYVDDSKLTSASGKIKVKPEQVVVDGDVVEQYIPLFDELMADVNTSINDMKKLQNEVELDIKYIDESLLDCSIATRTANEKAIEAYKASNEAKKATASANEAIAKIDNINANVSKTGNVSTLTVTDKDGVARSVEIKDGEQGPQGIQGEIGPVGPQGEQGIQGLQGEPGKDGTNDYNELTNIPTINGVNVKGNITLDTMKNITQSQNIWQMEIGIYKVAAGVNLYVSANSTVYPSTYERMLFVYAKTGTYTNFMLYLNDKETSAKLVYGFTNSSNYKMYSLTFSDIVNFANKSYVDEKVNSKRSKLTVYASEDTTYTINYLYQNRIYRLKELVALTISQVNGLPFDEETTIYFTSGATPTSITMPNELINLGDVPELELSEDGTLNIGTCEANKKYIISILNDIAIWKAY